MERHFNGYPTANIQQPTSNNTTNLSLCQDGHNKFVFFSFASFSVFYCVVDQYPSFAFFKETLMEPGYLNEAPEPMSFTDKIVSLFASPGELFEHVRTSGPTNSNWLVPWMIYAAVSIAVGQLILSNPSLSSQLEQTIRQQFEQTVQEAITEGAITREEADQQFEQFGRPGSPWFTLLSTGGTLLGSLAVLFALSLFYLLLGRSAMRASAPYMKVVEVVGLTFLIGALEGLVATALMFATDSIHASPSLALTLSKVDLENKFHLALSKVNLFAFWDIAVTSIGLSRLFEKDFPKVLVLIAVLWILWSAFSIFSGFSMK
jgi:hypothetical protein